MSVIFTLTSCWVCWRRWWLSDQTSNWYSCRPPSTSVSSVITLTRLQSYRSEELPLFENRGLFQYKDHLSRHRYSHYMYINPLRAKFFRGNIKHIFTFYDIPTHWYDTGGWNPSSNKTRTYPFYIINIMTVGVLATQGARTSAAMILT